MSEVPKGELIIYQTDDGLARVECRLVDETIWLSQDQMGTLFGKSKKTISEHVRNIFSEGELAEELVVRKFRTTTRHGAMEDRTQTREVQFYSLDMIIAVGYRVRSAQGTQFRIWATQLLKEYVTKGFVMDDERLKNPGGWDYFDELLARIRDIRASEKRFYQKVRDLFALSNDYDGHERETLQFFAEVQNKLLYAVTDKTAAELVVDRADSGSYNMALTSWSGSRVRKHDVIVAKNYLTADEIDVLNRLVVIFLEEAELRVKLKRQPLTLDFWRDNVDRMLAHNDQPILGNAGSISHEDMKSIAHERYDEFDNNRRQQEALAADADDLLELKAIENQLRQQTKK